MIVSEYRSFGAFCESVSPGRLGRTDFSFVSGKGHDLRLTGVGDTTPGGENYAK